MRFKVGDIIEISVFSFRGTWTDDAEILELNPGNEWPYYVVKCLSDGEVLKVADAMSRAAHAVGLSREQRRTEMILTIEQLKRLAEAKDGYSEREIQDIEDTWFAMKPVFDKLKPLVEIWNLRDTELAVENIEETP